MVTEDNEEGPLMDSVQIKNQKTIESPKTITSSPIRVSLSKSKRLSMQKHQKKMEQNYIQENQSQKNIILMPHTPPSDGAVEMIPEINKNFHSGITKPASMDTSELINYDDIEEEKNNT